APAAARGERRAFECLDSGPRREPGAPARARPPAGGVRGELRRGHELALVDPAAGKRGARRGGEPVPALVQRPRAVRRGRPGRDRLLARSRGHRQGLRDGSGARPARAVARPARHRAGRNPLRSPQRRQRGGAAPARLPRRGRRFRRRLRPSRHVLVLRSLRYGVQLDAGLCRVRDWRRSDRGSLVRCADNRNVWRNLGHRFPHPYTPADADAWLAYVRGTPGCAQWAIEVDGLAVGGIGIEPGEGIFAKCARFGYWLGEPWWGRGIATAAASATADYVLERFDLVRLEAAVFEWNPASMRVLEKAGFEREAVLKRSVWKDGRIIDAVLYARLR